MSTYDAYKVNVVNNTAAKDTLMLSKIHIKHPL